MYIDIENLEFIAPFLRKIVIELELYLIMGINETSLKDVTITSLYRINDKGVHGQLPLRGLDVRCQDAAAGQHLETLLNQAYIYDPDRPGKKVAIYHDTGNGQHLHLQTHPNSIVRGV